MVCNIFPRTNFFNKQNLFRTKFSHLKMNRNIKQKLSEFAQNRFSNAIKIHHYHVTSIVATSEKR